MKIEEIQQQKQFQNNQLQKIQKEMEVLQEIKEKKDISNQNTLNNALKKAGAIDISKNKALTDRDKNLIAKTLLENDDLAYNQ